MGGGLRVYPPKAVGGEENRIPRALLPTSGRSINTANPHHRPGTPLELVGGGETPLVVKVGVASCPSLMSGTRTGTQRVAGPVMRRALVVRARVALSW